MWLIISGVCAFTGLGTFLFFGLGITTDAGFLAVAAWLLVASVAAGIVSLIMED